MKQNLTPNSFGELMAGLLTIMLVVFTLGGVALNREVPEFVQGFTAAAVGLWFTIPQKTNDEQ